MREGEESGLLAPEDNLNTKMLSLSVTQGVLEHKCLAVSLVSKRGTESQRVDSSYSVDTLENEKGRSAGDSEVGSGSSVLQATWSFEQSQLICCCCCCFMS